MKEDYKYEGLVLGGPLDGRYLKNYRGVYRVALAPKEFRDYADADMCASDASHPILDYHWQPFYLGERMQKFNVWLTEEKTRDEIMQMLIDGYRRPQLNKDRA